jgi:hypothetical protein
VNKYCAFWFRSKSEKGIYETPASAQTVAARRRDMGLTFPKVLVLPYKLVYKSPLRYKSPRFISPLLAKGCCKICMAHRPSTIVNPFAISPPLERVICLARAT